MLSLQDLRTICLLMLKVNPDFRSLLLAAVIYDKDDLGELFFSSEYSLNRFSNVLSAKSESPREEERLLIDTVKKIKNPTSYNLLLSLCQSNTKLINDLKTSGLNVKILEAKLEEQLAVKNKTIIDQVTGKGAGSLTQLPNFRYN